MTKMQRLLDKSSDIKYLYEIECLSVQDLAKFFSVSRYTMYISLNKIGVKLRGPAFGGSNAISKLLRQKSITVSEFVEKTGISHLYFSKMLKGKIKNLKLRQALRVIEVLDLQDEQYNFLKKLEDLSNKDLRVLVRFHLEKITTLKRVDSEFKALSELIGVHYVTLQKNFARRTSLGLGTSLKIYDLFFPGVSSYSIEILRVLNTQKEE